MERYFTEPPITSDGTFIRENIVLGSRTHIAPAQRANMPTTIITTWHTA